MRWPFLLVYALMAGLHFQALPVSVSTADRRPCRVYSGASAYVPLFLLVLLEPSVAARSQAPVACDPVLTQPLGFGDTLSFALDLLSMRSLCDTPLVLFQDGRDGLEGCGAFRTGLGIPVRCSACRLLRRKIHAYGFYLRGGIPLAG
ncbi:hypothetical protein C8F01DRAFT_1088244 [Mycena amicta]|nr:hypothetical protein C8F01DRAFT_1088244 [Mycena amicta]